MWIHMRQTNLIIEQDNVEVRRSLIEEMKAKKNAVCLWLFRNIRYSLTCMDSCRLKLKAFANVIYVMGPPLCDILLGWKKRLRMEKAGRSMMQRPSLKISASEFTVPHFKVL